MIKPTSTNSLSRTRISPRKHAFRICLRLLPAPQIPDFLRTFNLSHTKCNAARVSNGSFFPYMAIFSFRVVQLPSPRAVTIPGPFGVTGVNLFTKNKPPNLSVSTDFCPLDTHDPVAVFNMCTKGFVFCEKKILLRQLSCVCCS